MRQFLARVPASAIIAVYALWVLGAMAIPILFGLLVRG